MNTADETCTTCGDTIIIRHRWRKLTPTQRTRLRAAGYNSKACNNECTRCRQYRHRLAHPVERSFRTNQETLDDFFSLVDYSRTRNANVRLIAPRLGVTVKGLEKALARGGVAPWAADRAGVGAA